MTIGPFQPGDRLTAAQMNEIARAAAKIMRLTGDKFIQATHTADGVTLHLATTDLAAYLPRPKQGFWARLTGEAAGKGGYYSWKRLKEDGETDAMPAMTGADNAKEVQEIEGLKVGAADGRVVWLEKDGTDDPAEWRFDTNAPDVAFLVKVTKDGGVSGGPAANCSWTYTVKDLGGTTLGATVAPQRARYFNTAYTQAPDDSYGLAAYDGETLKLLVCFGEIEQAGPCP